MQLNPINQFGLVNEGKFSELTNKVGFNQGNEKSAAKVLFRCRMGTRRSTRFLGDSSARESALPFDLVEPSVAAVDIVVVITASVLAGVGYHSFFLNYVPNVIPYVFIGALASLNFATNVIALR